MHFVTRATLIDDINRKSYKMEVKSSHNYSTNHMKPLVIYGLGGVHPHTHTPTRMHAHTHTHTHTHTRKVISRNQACTSLRPAHAWFKNTCMQTKQTIPLESAETTYNITLTTIFTYCKISVLVVLIIKGKHTKKVPF